MEIVIYWDSLFLLNFIMNYWILRVLSYKFALGVKRFRVVLAALIGASMYLLSLLFFAGTRYIQFLEICISISLMVLLILPRNDRRLFWKVSLNGVFCGFFVAGILRTIFAKGRLLFRAPIHIFSVLTFGYIIIEGIRMYLYNQKQLKKQRLLKVTLRTKKGKACIMALLDTGNGLIEPISKKPVCLVESGILENLLDKEQTLFRAIPYRSVGCEKGILYGTEIPEIQITYGGRKIFLKEVFCAETMHKLSTNDTYKMILHPECIEEI